LEAIADGRYVYCIIECDKRKSFGAIGIGGHREVYTVSYKDVSAVVSDTPLVEYEPIEENALTHMNVIQRVMQEHTVLPLRFCTIFKGDVGLRSALARLYHESKTELRRLEDKVELGVKVLWHPDRAAEEVRKMNDRIRTLEEEMKGKTPGIGYLLKIKLDEALKEELNRMTEEYSAIIFKELKNHALEARQSQLIGHMILNAAFLMHKSSENDFRSAVEIITERHRPNGLEFLCSGPWPPFNFVNIRYE